VFVGDLVDRGPDPVGVVRRVRELGAACVMGNHEEVHLRWRKHEDRRRRDPEYRNPMKPLRAEDAAHHAALSDDDIAWMAALPAHVDVAPGWKVVHAGFEPRRPLARQLPAMMMRIRRVHSDGRMVSGLAPEAKSVPWATRWRGPSSVVYGHDVHGFDRPRVDAPAPGVECWGIDTGCCFGGKLTALSLPDREIAQVSARRAYVPFTEAE
jgi:hypothetical protein